MEQNQRNGSLQVAEETLYLINTFETPTPLTTLVIQIE